MRITEAAKILGVGPDWIRRLEKRGRIPPAKRDFNHHRRYTDEDIKRLRATLFGSIQTKAGSLASVKADHERRGDRHG